ncbi:hypothetical protein ACFXDJ_15340 [Streptomyces sp. NPDC059443]|uniref:hypothetical protein n=1 Tax=unclassified Streptomyces TaxID=2593676 RepID=UPI00368EE9E4
MEKAPWIYSRVISSGFFYTDKPEGKRADDMVTCWRDGEVTLYQGDPDGDFDKEHQLIDPKAEQRFKNATSMTAGNFTGSGNNDLLVRWKGGDISLFKNVTPHHKLKEEIKIAPPKGDEDVWKKKVVSVTSGKFQSDGKRDDVVVLWTDGEVTRYSLSEQGFGSQTQLLKPNKQWNRTIASISAGHLDATGNTAISDLLVQWKSGKVSVHDYTPGRELPPGVFIQKDASKGWGDALITVGNHHREPGDKRDLRDDLIVRWTSGKLSMFQDTSIKGLGKERVLAQAP